MRLYDAYRRGYITYQQYEEYIDTGLGPDSPWYPSDPLPVPPVPDPEDGETTDSEVLVYSLMVNVLSAYSVCIENTGETHQMSFRIDRVVGNTIIDSISDYIVPGDNMYVSFTDAIGDINVYVWSKDAGNSTTFTVSGSVSY